MKRPRVRDDQSMNNTKNIQTWTIINTENIWTMVVIGFKMAVGSGVAWLVSLLFGNQVKRVYRKVSESNICVWRPSSKLLQKSFMITVTHSSTEAEYKGLSNVFNQLAWLVYLKKEIDMPPPIPPQLWCVISMLLAHICLSCFLHSYESCGNWLTLCLWQLLRVIFMSVLSSWRITLPISSPILLLLSCSRFYKRNFKSFPIFLKLKHCIR